MKFGLLVWFFTLLIGFTVAYFLAFHVRSLTMQIVLFLLCTIPFWTSNVIRMISWIPLLALIRQAVRNIESAIKRIEVTRATIVLAQTQLEAEQEKFRLGLSTSFQVLEFQRDLTDARSAATRALSDYNVELARLDQRMGTSRYGKSTAAGK